MSNAAIKSSLKPRQRVRNTFGRIDEVAAMPSLIAVQKRSYDEFLQMGVEPDDRENLGLQGCFESVFPVSDFSERAELEFVSYAIEDPDYDVTECRERGLTYAAPLKATFRLSVFEVDDDTGARTIRDIKEQDVYMVDLPLMTENGTFIINGTERVIISQMHRSPGVFFYHDDGKKSSTNKVIYSARVIPYRGSWLDIEFSTKDIIRVRIDRRRKLPVSTLFYALDDDETAEYRAKQMEAGEKLDQSEMTGLTTGDILDYFYNTIEISRDDDQDGWQSPFDPDKMKGVKLASDLVNAEDGKVVATAGTTLTNRKNRKLIEDGLENALLSNGDLVGRYLANDVVDPDSGEVIADINDEITKKMVDEFIEAGVERIELLDIDNVSVGPYMRNTVAKDKNESRETALLDIYRVMRPGDPPTLEEADELFRDLFFNPDKYDLSDVGRMKTNQRLGFDTSDDMRTLRREDILQTVKVLHDLRDGHGTVDDIDHLGNRRVRSVGELMENKMRIGLVRMERSIKDRMSSVEIETAMPHDLINAKPAAGVVKEFFGSSQLSQFMDQTNPLSEVTHKRRISALGPGGLTRERAGFEVRDVHTTHYGRICPIETPEGQNIGLINSLATYSKINKYGFIETPYRKVVDGKVTEEVVYLSATDEEGYTIAQANATLDDSEKFVDDLVSCRTRGDYIVSRPEEIDFMDVSPKQTISVSAALIPFLENDDVTRALMGSNMQRQAVPLLKPDAPLVGTGIESVVARDSGAAVTARRAGVVDQVDAERIVIQASEADDVGVPTVDIYKMRKFQRSNQDSCINQKPLVKVGDVVEQGDIIADGPSTEDGELALGKNVLCAFMPWHGFNYEDSILISERVVRDDVYTSVHLEEFELSARDTKLGQEEVTRDIPNVGEEALRNLDEAGIVYIGAQVKSGDILVGKVTPKGESPITPEEKLLRAIFGEKAADVKDSSLRLPTGVEGTVVDVQVFNRRGVEKDQRALSIEREEIERLAQDRDDERRIQENSFYGRLKEMLIGEEIVKSPDKTIAKKGDKVSQDILDELPRSKWPRIVVDNDDLMDTVEAMTDTFNQALDELQATYEDKVSKLQTGDDLKPGVLRMVKVFIAVKRKMQPGDKMAGRHGNKGVVSRILPVEDMPFMDDGTPVDIVLNPLGVPSRMNIGQILETHLGWASAKLGHQIGELVDDIQDEADGKSATKKQAKKLRDKLKDVYSERSYNQDIKPMDDDDLLEMSDKLRGGVPMASPVFDGARDEDISSLLEKAGVDRSGQVTLYDGQTGEKFDRQVTVGYIYMLKLHHLIDDKIHARSIGPYSLVTQQPLGGKAQFGGQRLGEMEVWALEAYGAAYTLQEMLTIKSDDVSGRTKAYESIIRGENTFEIGMPESFNVLVKELRGLGLNVDLLEEEY